MFVPGIQDSLAPFFSVKQEARHSLHLAWLLLPFYRSRGAFPIKGFDGANRHFDAAPRIVLRATIKSACILDLLVPAITRLFFIVVHSLTTHWTQHGFPFLLGTG